MQANWCGQYLALPQPNCVALVTDGVSLGLSCLSVKWGPGLGLLGGFQGLINTKTSKPCLVNSRHHMSAKEISLEQAYPRGPNAERKREWAERG